MSAKPSSGGVIVGVDVGGTFTDIFALDEAAGRVSIGKTPSTKPDQSVGFMRGLGEQTERLSDIAAVVHGTTVGTNALLERRGARTGLITTRGFRDVLEMRRRDRPTTWGLWGMYEPIIPRDRRLEVTERVLADGSVLEPVRLEEVEAAARALLEMGCDSVAIAFVNAYANAENEAAAAAAVRALWPNPHVTAATEILPEIREFERVSTAALNAYLQPPVASYLSRLEAALAEQDAQARVLIVQSNGGLMTVENARAAPVRTALSGPAAGVTAAAHIAEKAGFPNVITCDMGGTSFDVSLIADGRPSLSAQTSVDFGLRIRAPMIEIETIGAGGGSIASVDAGGLLQVGPESAGSDPGPAAYRRGGDRPTVTDANILMGRINADQPIGGVLEKLDLAAAEAAIARDVGEPLGLDPLAAAEAIVQVANAKMAGAIRLISIERGHDPKSFVAMPFGGGGALHACALVKEVGLRGALAPRYPGVTSALGCVIADMRHDYVRTVNSALADFGEDAMRGAIEADASEGERLIAQSGARIEATERRVSFDMLYAGQTHAVTAELPSDAPITREAMRAAFESAYRDAYGRLLEGAPVLVAAMRVAVIGRRPKFDLALLAPDGAASVDAARLGERPVWIDGAWRTAEIYDRLALPVGARVPGPAVLEQPDATIFVEPDMVGEVDAFGNLLITPGAR